MIEDLEREEQPQRHRFSVADYFTLSETYRGQVRRRVAVKGRLHL